LNPGAAAVVYGRVPTKPVRITSATNKDGTSGDSSANGEQTPAPPSLPGWRAPVAALWMLVVVVGFVAAIGGRALLHLLG
jgi:hypothetical protein